MLIDLTLNVTPEMETEAQGSVGRLGTHLVVLKKEVPPELVRRQGIVFDVNRIRYRDISSKDIDLQQVSKNMFVAFRSGFIERIKYGGKLYFSGHPQLADELIDRLLDKGVSMIGLDFAGLRRGEGSACKDEYCAERGAFVVKNLCNLNQVLAQGNGTFIANLSSMNDAQAGGLPCRVVAEV